MMMSEPVRLPTRALARNVTRAATSPGRVNRPVTEAAAALAATLPGAPRTAPPTVSATPPLPSQRSVATGPGLTVFTRTPFGPTSFDSDLKKLRHAALAAL